MAKIKFDVSNVEDMPERTPAPVGVYRATIVKAEPKESSKGNQMIEVQYRLTHDGAGKKLKEEFGDLWDYPILDHDHPFVQARLKEFIAAVGLKSKGTLDTDKLVGKSVQVKLKSDTDQDGDYRPRVGKVMSLPTEDIPEDEDEDEEDIDSEEEDDDEEELDLDDLDRDELKALIKEEELEIKVKKSMTDDDIREAIAELLGDDEDEDDEEDEDEEEDAESEDEDDDDEEDGDNYEELSLADLKAELKERELSTSGSKKILVARLRKDDQEEPF